MTKLIQICASQNDLFGLDGDGIVYQYNFNTNNWSKLGGGPTTSGQPQSERRSAKERRGRPS
jgi:hypothetical protein